MTHERKVSTTSRPVFAGVDCETTGSVEREHELIQIGVALRPTEIFVSRIGWKKFNYDPAALRAIGVDPAGIAEGPDSDAVDAELVRWLEARGIPERSIVSVGWGVSGFDLPFVRRTLPRFYSRYVTHRTVELNAVCYTLADNKAYGDSVQPFDAWKTMAKKAAELHAKIGYEIEPHWHDAGYDALTSLLAWRWLCGIVADPNPASKKTTPGRQ